MFSKPIEQPELKEEKYSESYESAFISFIVEFLNILFKIALVNFSKKNSKFTLNENFQKLFDDNNMNNMNEFKNLVDQLNQELSSIQNLFDLDSKDVDFCQKDINFELLIDSINNCFMFCENDLNIDELVNNLSQIFQKLITKKNIKSNNNSNIIITQFHNYINCYLNNIDKIKSMVSTTAKFEEKKNDNTQIQDYIIKIKKLEGELQNYTFRLNQKQIEIEGEKKKNTDLNQILAKKTNEWQLQKTEDDNIKNTLLNEIKNLKNKFENMEKNHSEEMKNMEKNHSEEMKNMKKNHSEEMKNMEKRLSEQIKNMEKKHSKEMEIVNTKIENLEKENYTLKLKIAYNCVQLLMKDQKLEKLQELVKQVRYDMNKLSDIGKDLSESLNETIDVLDNVKSIMDDYEFQPK